MDPVDIMWGAAGELIVMSALLGATAQAQPPALGRHANVGAAAGGMGALARCSSTMAFSSGQGLALGCGRWRRRQATTQRTKMLFDDLKVAPCQLQAMLRRDISRRFTELNALAWLGRAYLAVPWLFDTVFPSVFALTPYAVEAAPCYRCGGHLHVCLKEASILSRGIPFRLALSGGPARITAAELSGIGPDLALAAADPETETEVLDKAELATLCQTLAANRIAKRLVVSAIVETIFERLTPVAAAVERDAELEAYGKERAFVPRRDLYAVEGSAKKWLQNVAEYFFADARLQTVRFAEGAEGLVLFDFYLDPSEPLNSEDMYQNINPEVISCSFPTTL